MKTIVLPTVGVLFLCIVVYVYLKSRPQYEELFVLNQHPKNTRKMRVSEIAQLPEASEFARRMSPPRMPVLSSTAGFMRSFQVCVKVVEMSLSSNHTVR
ncbi:hypothetical protein AND_002065 [Anopheles darlingi]|uniref:Uncharacterized protein n=1 Tax=Anopheles darlingi TaxID=43151 RepID=W5JT79_ANODA|nr:hypothetical protein AND_002065 [Anopheles darlingi]